MPALVRRKKYVRKRRVIRKRRVKRIPRPLGRTTSVIRGAYFSTISSTASLESYGAYSFKLSDLPNYTEFTSLFDQYKIARVTLYFVQRNFTQNISTSVSTPWFIYAIDKDDAVAPTAYSQLLEYPGSRITTMSRPHKVSFVPMIATDVYNGVSTAYSSASRFVDCTYPGVPHYGFKYGFNFSTTAGVFSYDIFVKYRLLFRGVH